MLTETQIEKAKQTDLLALIGQDTKLKKVANTNGGEYAGACPFCGGRDRLRVQPERGKWWCRQCGDEHWSDAIGYIQKRDSVDFLEACRRLGSQNLAPTRLATQPTETKNTTPPSVRWQGRAHEWIKECEKALWSELGAKARDWLHSRGLNDDTLQGWHIGYNATDQWDNARNWGLNDGERIWLPRGVVIPCEVGNSIWYVKIRRPHRDPKYIQPRGSVPALFGANTLGQHDYAVLTEGEFDALLTWQCLQHATNLEWHRIGVATLGSATNHIDLNAWARFLLPIGRLLVCYDTDHEGNKGAGKWDALTSRTRRVNVPSIQSGDKDLTDFHKSGGRILDLIVFEIARDRWQGEQGISSKAAQVAQTAHLAQPINELIVQEPSNLPTLRSNVSAEWNRLMDQLESMDQDTVEFDEKLAQWEKVNEEYKRLDDLVYEQLGLISKQNGNL